MDFLTLIIVILIGSWIVDSIKHAIKKKRALEEKRKHEEEIRNALSGIKAGVWIKEPNGSSHMIQNLIEQGLSSRGTAVFDLRSKPTKSLMDNGEWDRDIASGTLDVAIVGRIIIRTSDMEEYEYPTVQNVDTETGMGFHELGEDHPRYREPNDESWESDEPIYVEPDEQYYRRREIEKVPVVNKRKYCTLDVRFYGPDGQIRGGCAAQEDDKTVDPMEELKEKLLRDLALAVKPSIAAHERELSLRELDSLSHK